MTNPLADNIAFYERELESLEQRREDMTEDAFESLKRAIEWNLGAMRKLYATFQEEESAING